MTNPDFTTANLFLGHVIPEKAGGLWYAGQIERYVKRDRWKDELAQVPDEHRARAAEYLRDRWKILSHRDKLAKVGKQNPVADQELAKMGELVRRIMP